MGKDVLDRWVVGKSVLEKCCVPFPSLWDRGAVVAVLGQAGVVTGAVSHAAFPSQAQLFWFVSAHKNSKCRGWLC